MSDDLAPIRCDIRLDSPPARVFSLLTDDLLSWWPRAYTWSGDVLETIAIEPRIGGRCFERGPHGFHLDWGRVLVCDRPRRLVFTWQIGAQRVPEPDPARASEVAIELAGDGDGGSVVTLEHRGFACHGVDAARYRDMMAGPRGWPFLIDRLAAAVREPGGPTQPTP